MTQDQGHVIHCKFWNTLSTFQTGEVMRVLDDLLIFSLKDNKPQSRFWIVASVCSYSGLQGAGNRDYCAVATQGVSKRNPSWPGWRPAGGRGQCVYACHRALESSMAQTDAFDY